MSARLEREASLSETLANTGDLAFWGNSRNGLFCAADPVNNTDPTGNETISEIAIVSSIGQGLHNKYDAGVTTVGNSLKNTLIGVAEGMSVNQIVALNLLDNAGGVVAGGLIGKAAQLRKLPGIVKGIGKLIQGNRWLRGSHGNAGPIPAQIATKLAGRKFANFDEFRAAFWKEVAADAELGGGFSASNATRMRQGKAPYAVKTQQVGEKQVYEIHHTTPIQHEGELYDMDNMVVVTPRYHQEVLDPFYHY